MDNIKSSFPAINQTVYGKQLVYLDNGATTQKPQSVLDAMQQYYSLDNANVHRGVHYLSQKSDKAFEAVRRKAQHFIGASLPEEIIFTYGTTDAINLLAHSLGELLSEGDEIIITEMEHHANIVPWQMLRDRKNIKLKVVKIHDDGLLDIEHYRSLLSDRTKIVSVSHVSNVLGIANPIGTMIAMAHEYGAKVIIDAAQSIAHVEINVKTLDCDFLVFSAHKMYGPTGVGVLYGKKEHLEAMPPFRGGGAMINEVRFDKTTYNVLPFKFEAGTPPIAAIVGMGAAIDFIQSIGMHDIERYERELSHYLYHSLERIQDVNILGSFHDRAPIVSFTLGSIHAHDVATILDKQGVAARAGHHCAMPLMERYGVNATTRVCAGIYNTLSDIDTLVTALKTVREVFE